MLGDDGGSGWISLGKTAYGDKVGAMGGWRVEGRGDWAGVGGTRRSGRERADKLGCTI